MNPRFLEHGLAKVGPNSFSACRWQCTKRSGLWHSLDTVCGKRQNIQGRSRNAAVQRERCRGRRETWQAWIQSQFQLIDRHSSRSEYFHLPRICFIYTYENIFNANSEFYTLNTLNDLFLRFLWLKISQLKSRISKCDCNKSSPHGQIH